MDYKYGHFSEDGTEFVVTRPDTPRPFDNFLWNDAIFSNVQQTGVGYCDYQVGDTEGIQLFTGIGRICDFDVFGRDHLMSRLVYIRDNDTGEFWTVNWEPVCKPYDRYECVHGLGYTIIRSAANGIAAEFRIFVPPGHDPVELWTLRIRNESANRRNLSVFVYNQFQFKYKWGFDSYGDMIYRASWLDRERNAVIAQKHPFRKPHDYLTGFMTSDEPIAAFEGTRDAFVGMYGTLAAPQAVVRGRCGNTPGSADATIGAAQYDVTLAGPGDERAISIVLGATDTPGRVSEFRVKYLGRFEAYFGELKGNQRQLVERNRIRTPDPHMDRMLNGWVKQAALFGATWCRWGWNGYRDLVQHGFGVSALEPERTRRILLEALRYQYNNGLALRGWNPVDEKPYSDSALWLVFTLIAYLQETGDMALLDETVPYYDGGSGTVREHIDRALDFLENNKGAHRLLLIKFGDWNDSLTGVGKRGRGESVWLSQAYAEAMSQMAELADFLGETDKKREYLARRRRIIHAINRHAWNGDWYVRCFDDDGNPVGDKSAEFARIFLETQSWGLISGAADRDRAARLIRSCDELLGTPAGYLLLSPPFTRIVDSIGRISSMEPGIAENGTVYSHLNIWMIMGLLRHGMPDRAYELFRKITPGYPSGEDRERDFKQNCPPYMYANCYFGPEHKNNKFQMEFTWITGSVAWFNNVLLRYMLGVRPEFGGLRVDPCLPSGWEECFVERHFRNAVYRIAIRNPKRLPRGRVRLRVDGNRLRGSLIPVFADGRVHEAEVIIE